MPQTSIDPTDQKPSINTLLNYAMLFSNNQKALLQHAQEEVSSFSSHLMSGLDI